MISLSYFWIVEYQNGLALPEFDPGTGIENKIELDRKDIKRISWNPMTEKVKIAADNIMKEISMFDTKRIIIDIDEGDIPIIYRENHLPFSGVRGGDQIIKYVIGKEKNGVKMKLIVDDNSIVLK